jgi:DNA-binding NtrC family response regulator
VEENMTALLVYNEEEPLDDLHVRLENLKVRTRRALSCREAAQLIAGGLIPHMIFTDMELPDGTWRDVIQIAASSETPISVIIVSRQVDIKAYIETIECGAYDFIVPPFATADLNHVLRGAVWHMVNRGGKLVHAAECSLKYGSTLPNRERREPEGMYQDGKSPLQPVGLSAKS